MTLLFKETHHNKNLNALRLSDILGNYKSLMLHRQYAGYTLTSLFSYGTLFGIATIYPFIFMQSYHFSVVAVGQLFALNGAGILGMGLISPAIANRVGLVPWLRVGALGILVSGLVLLVASSVWPQSALAAIIPILMATTAIGVIRPTASAGAMSLVEPKVAGSAASMFSFASFLGGGISTLAISLLPFSVSILALFIMLFGAIAVVCALYTGSKSGVKEMAEVPVSRQAS